MCHDRPSEPKPVWPARLPPPWAALGHGCLWPPPPSPFGRDLLETGVIGEPKVNSPTSPWGQVLEERVPAAVLTVCGALRGCRGQEPQGRTGHLCGSLVSSLLGADWSQGKGQTETCSVGVSATQPGVESNQNKSFL